jgi:anaerobic ribonucleoside-triphosphate reductase
MRWKCHTCFTIVEESPCPVCGETILQPMCEDDHCHCNHQIIEGVSFCKKCGKPMCPECGSHDVSQVSRVTGYLSDVAGWNKAKLAELKDRQRTNIIP